MTSLNIFCHCDPPQDNRDKGTDMLTTGKHSMLHVSVSRDPVHMQILIRRTMKDTQDFVLE